MKKIALLISLLMTYLIVFAQDTTLKLEYCQPKVYASPYSISFQITNCSIDLSKSKESLTFNYTLNAKNVDTIIVAFRNCEHLLTNQSSLGLLNLLSKTTFYHLPNISQGKLKMLRDKKEFITTIDIYALKGCRYIPMSISVTFSIDSTGIIKVIAKNLTYSDI